jgi:hypothetical protein
VFDSLKKVTGALNEQFVFTKGAADAANTKAIAEAETAAAAEAQAIARKERSLEAVALKKKEIEAEVELRNAARVSAANANKAVAAQTATPTIVASPIQGTQAPNATVAAAVQAKAALTLAEKEYAAAVAVVTEQQAFAAAMTQERIAAEKAMNGEHKNWKTNELIEAERMEGIATRNLTRDLQEQALAREALDIAKAKAASTTSMLSVAATPPPAVIASVETRAALVLAEKEYAEATNLSKIAVNELSAAEVARASALAGTLPAQQVGLAANATATEVLAAAEEDLVLAKEQSVLATIDEALAEDRLRASRLLAATTVPVTEAATAAKVAAAAAEGEYSAAVLRTNVVLSEQAVAQTEVAVATGAAKAAADAKALADARAAAAAAAAAVATTAQGKAALFAANAMKGLWALIGGWTGVTIAAAAGLWYLATRTTELEEATKNLIKARKELNDLTGDPLVLGVKTFDDEVKKQRDVLKGLEFEIAAKKAGPQKIVTSELGSEEGGATVTANVTENEIVVLEQKRDALKKIVELQEKEALVRRGISESYAKESKKLTDLGDEFSRSLKVLTDAQSAMEHISGSKDKPSVMTPKDTLQNTYAAWDIATRLYTEQLKKANGNQAELKAAVQEYTRNMASATSSYWKGIESYANIRDADRLTLGKVAIEWNKKELDQNRKVFDSLELINKKTRELGNSKLTMSAADVKYSKTIEDIETERVRRIEEINLQQLKKVPSATDPSRFTEELRYVIADPKKRAQETDDLTAALNRYAAAAAHARDEEKKKASDDAKEKLAELRAKYSPEGLATKTTGVTQVEILKVHAEIDKLTKIINENLISAGIKGTTVPWTIKLLPNTELPKIPTPIIPPPEGTFVQPAGGEITQEMLDTKHGQILAGLKTEFDTKAAANLTDKERNRLQDEYLDKLSQENEAYQQATASREAVDKIKRSTISPAANGTTYSLNDLSRFGKNDPNPPWLGQGITSEAETTQSAREARTEFDINVAKKAEELDAASRKTIEDFLRQFGKAETSQATTKTTRLQVDAKIAEFEKLLSERAAKIKAGDLGAGAVDTTTAEYEQWFAIMIQGFKDTDAAAEKHASAMSQFMIQAQRNMETFLASEIYNVVSNEARDALKERKEAEFVAKLKKSGVKEGTEQYNRALLEWQKNTSSVSLAFESMAEAFSKALQKMIAELASSQILEALTKLAKLVTTSIMSGSDSTPDTTAPVPSSIVNSGRAATGGLIRGPGTSTSDSIPMLLSNGEFVIQASAVQKYGKEFFDKVNSQDLSTQEDPAKGFSRAPRVQRRAEGGFIAAPGATIAAPVVVEQRPSYTPPSKVIASAVTSSLEAIERYNTLSFDKVDSSTHDESLKTFREKYLTSVKKDSSTVSSEDSSKTAKSTYAQDILKNYTENVLKKSKEEVSWVGSNTNTDRRTASSSTTSDEKSRKDARDVKVSSLEESARRSTRVDLNENTARTENTNLTEVTNKEARELREEITRKDAREEALRNVRESALRTSRDDSAKTSRETSSKTSHDDSLKTSRDDSSKKLHEEILRDSVESAVKTSKESAERLSKDASSSVSSTETRRRDSAEQEKNYLESVRRTAQDTSTKAVSEISTKKISEDTLRTSQEKALRAAKDTAEKASSETILRRVNEENLVSYTEHVLRKSWDTYSKLSKSGAENTTLDSLSSTSAEQVLKQFSNDHSENYVENVLRSYREDSVKNYGVDSLKNYKESTLRDYTFHVVQKSWEDYYRLAKNDSVKNSKDTSVNSFTEYVLSKASREVLPGAAAENISVRVPNEGYVIKPEIVRKYGEVFLNKINSWSAPVLQSIAGTPVSTFLRRAEGGMIRGPGTSTSDSIPTRLPAGSYVIKASTVQKYGGEFLERFNSLAAPVGVQRRADGGAIFGPGTGTSDSIPALVSNGEFIVQAAAVQKYGVSFFDKLNSQQLAPTIPAVRRFSEGGLVSGGTRALSGSEGGGGETTVNVINNTGQETSTEKIKQPDGSEIINIVIGKVAQDIRNNGMVGQSIQSTFGASRKGVNRG